MATTSSTAFSAALTFKVQANVLENLRGNLLYGDPAYAEQGTKLGDGIDALTFVTVPDLSTATTPLTEGTAPTAVALTISTVLVSTAQYGNLVEISDLAKVKSPVEIVTIASEHVARNAKESINQIIRDVIAASGTPFYPTGSTNTVRSDIASTEKATAADLQRLGMKMRKAKLPRFDDNFYRIFFSPDQVYDLMADTTASVGFLEASKYTTTEPLTNAEIGQLHGFRILTSDSCPTFSSTTTVHAAIAVGAIKGWGMGDLQTLETPVVGFGGDHSDPLGQKMEIGWKVDFGVAALSNSYYYRYETAVTGI